MKVGDIVYVVHMRYRIGDNTEAVAYTITKVGRKYFEIDNGNSFFIDTLMHNAGQHSSRYKAYLSLEDIENERFSNQLYSDIKNFFSGYSRNPLSLEKLKLIHKTINE